MCAAHVSKIENGCVWMRKVNNSRVCLLYFYVVVTGAQLHVIITYSLFNGLAALNETIENYSKSFLLLKKKNVEASREGISL
jgi:hypothetical protein